VLVDKVRKHSEAAMGNIVLWIILGIPIPLLLLLALIFGHGSV